jgi:hypothetical protein
MVKSAEALAREKKKMNDLNREGTDGCRTAGQRSWCGAAEDILAEENRIDVVGGTVGVGGVDIFTLYQYTAAQDTYRSYRSHQR